MHSGGIPGTDHPTDRGLDPYIATRGNEGWCTEYVGIPANYPGAAGSSPFSSTLLEADAGLYTFAFGGPEICAPCFADGSTGIPVHTPGGQLVQGMAGSEARPSAKPAGYIAHHLSADGNHLIFGSTSLFAPGGNDENGEISIYDRDLKTGETHVISNAPTTEDFPAPLPCLTNCESDGIAELAVSSDGSHILIGQLVKQEEGKEGEGHDRYWHLYMEANDEVSSIELTPGATEGVLFDGMTEDGSKVFFTSKEQLSSEDSDTQRRPLHVGRRQAAQARLDRAKRRRLRRMRPGRQLRPPTLEHGRRRSDLRRRRDRWWWGGGRPAGDVYFLSPELLAGSEEPTDGTQNAPNLYVARPGEGYAPRFVATLESDLTVPAKPKLRYAKAQTFASSLAGASALATDPSSGDVYVLDAAANTVEKFDPAGHLVTSFGDTENETTHEPEPDGRLAGRKTPAGSFSFSVFGIIPPGTLAVDPSTGDLYVPDGEHGVIDRFSSSGEYLSQVSANFPVGAAVDAENGDLYVSDTFGEVQIFSASGAPPLQVLRRRTPALRHRRRPPTATSTSAVLASLAKAAPTPTAS